MPPRMKRGTTGLRGGAALPTVKTEETLSSVAAQPESGCGDSGIQATERPDFSSVEPVALGAAARSTSSRSFKLRPKAVRRADEERRALAEQEEKKLHDRVAADDARRRRENRLRGGRGGRGRGRGRGDFGGWHGSRAEPNGPFSQGPLSQSRGGGRGLGGLGGGGGGGGGSFGGGGGRGSGPGSGIFATSSNAAAELDPRLNTDIFNGRSGGYGDHEDVDDNGDGVLIKDEHAVETISIASSGKSKLAWSKQQQQLLPMGIKREEHRDREVVVATTAELEAAERESAEEEQATASTGDGADLVSGMAGSGGRIGPGSILDEDGHNDDNEVWSRAITAQRGVKLVGPDGEEIEITEIDTLAEKREEIAAARAAKEKVIADDAEAKMQGAHIGGRSKRRGVQKDPEDVNVEEGLQAMLRDLAMDVLPQKSGTTHTSNSLRDNDDETSKQEQEQEQEQQAQGQEQAEVPHREGRLFLFQFPPIMPALQSFAPIKANNIKDGNNSSSTAGANGIVKQEPGVGDDIVMMDSAAPMTAAVDLTGSDTYAGVPGNVQLKPENIGTGGFLGELVIRKSGRAELSWGGMMYEMMPGTDVQFLTTAVLLEDADEKKTTPSAGGLAVAPETLAGVAGNAFGMGPVGGKYNLVPVFNEEQEWEVDEAELELEQ